MQWIIFSLVFLFSLLSKCGRCSAISPKNTILVHSAVLDPAGKFELSWNFNEEIIVFEVRVLTLGYVGFGLSSNGDMTGSDIVIGGVSNSDGLTYFTQVTVQSGWTPSSTDSDWKIDEDRHATGKQEPVVDESPDWNIVYGSQSDTHTTLRFWRSLDTCDDDDDRQVKWETARVIWAYSDKDSDSVSYHSANRGSKSIFLLNPQKTVPEIPEDSLIVDLLNNKLEVPDTPTTYWCQAFAIPEVDRKHHVIKFEPVVQPGHESLVHHIVLIGCFSPVTNETVGQGEYCYDGRMPRYWSGCSEITFAWAVGGGPFYFPEHVGFPFGYDGDPSLILLQTHYDNPGRIKGLIDSSGLRLTLSPRPRKYDAALLTTGVLTWVGLVIPPFSEKFRSDGHCVPECLTQAMGNHTTNINFFAGFLHGHLLATTIRFRHFRDGVEQKVILEDENYDFNFQETRMLNDEVSVLPGDHLVTECDYKSSNKDRVTFGGESTNEEMCFTFALYYPRIPLSNCVSGIDIEDIGNSVNATFFSNLTVREPEEFAGTPYSDFINDNVNWEDKTTRDRFQELVTTYDKPVRVMCTADPQTKHPVNLQKVKLPEVKVRFPEQDRSCNPTNELPEGTVRFPEQDRSSNPTDGAIMMSLSASVLFVSTVSCVLHLLV